MHIWHRQDFSAMKLRILGMSNFGASEQIAESASGCSCLQNYVRLRPAPFGEEYIR